MNPRDDEVIRAVREADPAASPEVARWAEGAQAEEIAERIRAGNGSPTDVTPPRRRGARTLVLVGVAIVALLTIGAALAVRSRAPGSPSFVACYPSLDRGAGPVLIRAPRDAGPIAACAEVWPRAFGTVAPARLVACVTPGGGSVVYPAPTGMSAADVCSASGAAVDANAGPGT